jgi:hypothetical protein
MSEGNAPAPTPLRWFGTTWVDRGPDYWLRRVAVSVGALAAVAAGAFLMRLAVQGVVVAGTGTFVELLLVLAVGVCSCVAALRTWHVLTRGKESLTGWMADEKQLGVMLAVGFVGSLASYFVRSLVEAPGEGVQRSRHELAVAAAARRQAGSRQAGSRRPAKAAKRRR